jgi:hypothetical protein
MERKPNVFIMWLPLLAATIGLGNLRGFFSRGLQNDRNNGSDPNRYRVAAFSFRWHVVRISMVSKKSSKTSDQPNALSRTGGSARRSDLAVERGRRDYSVLGLYDLIANCVPHQFTHGVQLQLAHDIGPMGLRGFNTDAETRSNLLAAFPLRK